LTRFVFYSVVAFALFASTNAEALRIVQPAAGTKVKPGQLVRVFVSFDPGETATRVGVISDVAPVDGTISGDGFEADIRIPAEGIGETLLIAYAELQGGGVAMARLSVDVDPGPIRSLLIAVPTLLTRAGQTAPVEVVGVFDDGVLRRLSAPDLGTTYMSDNAAVIGVSVTGVVQARHSGTATLSISNREKTTTVSIQVQIPVGATNRIPTLTLSPSQTVGPEQIVRLSVIAADPDGDALEYFWQQVGGRVVILHNGASANPEFVSPRTSQQQVLEFLVAVRDSNGAMTLPQLVRVVVSPTIPVGDE
jgi:hypothetical protein